jgi:hypothetical protein
MKKSYSELLKDPRWQKKRLSILKRDNFICKLCGDKETQLVVHHLIYHDELDPWNYKNNELITLCNHCHNSLHRNEGANIDFMKKEILGSFCKDISGKYIRFYSRNKRIAIHYSQDDESCISFLVDIDAFKLALKLHFNE